MAAESSRQRYLCWAEFSHQEIVEGRAKGNRRSLWLRARLQTFLFKLGHYAQTHSSPVIMVGLVVLIVCSLGFYNAKLETNVENLWMEVGGRLENELKYSKTYGYDYKSYEVIIQTPKTRGTNVLTPQALLKHAQVVQKAMQVEVEVFEQTWTVQDICTKPAVPPFDSPMSIVDKMLEQIIPCTVITPLDCFWDGAKIYTQNITTGIKGSERIHWTSFDPLKFLTEILPNETRMDLSQMDSMIAKGGISHGYINRPCLDPTEARCPISAPNKASKKIPDIGEQLTGGCKGFAERLMIWPEALLVGGIRKNRSGAITSAEALQSVINLMSEEELYNYWWENNGFLKNKVQHITDWDVDKARIVLNAWQRKFVKVINEISESANVRQNVLAFSTTSFNDLLRDFSSPNNALIIGGYCLMIIYACFTMIRWNSVVQSQGCMGILGVLLVSLSVAAGLGLCSFCGISFNAASTQVLPFLALGLGVDDMFLLSHTYRDLNSRNLRSKEQAGYCLSTTGVSIMLTSITNAIAFFLAAILPIPALRALCLKAGVIIIFNFFSIVVIYPAMIGIDVRRREDQRYDIFCCVRRDNSTSVRNFRPDTSGSLATFNQTSSDDDSTLHQISSSANVSIGQSSGADAFTLPGIALKANCNINYSICDSMLGGDIMSLPGIGNFVVPAPSRGQNIDGESWQNASSSINANLSNITGGSMNISASSSANSSKRTNSRDATRDISSKINHGCTGPVNTDSRRTANAQSSVNIAVNSNRVAPSGAMEGIYATANATVDSSRGEASNGEVILRPENVRNSRQRSMAWQRTMNSQFVRNITRLSLGHLTKTYYAPMLQKASAKVIVLFLFTVIFSVSIYGCVQVKDGVDVTDVVPKGTKLAEFLHARNEYFSFYDIFIITKDDFDYANGQEKLIRLHEAFSKVDYIVKDKDGKLPKFWLHYFKEWLERLQGKFDEDRAKHAITCDGVRKNASTDGKLAYKLLLATGKANENSQVCSQKLVENDVVHRRGFYSFLKAWYRYDWMGYESSQVKIKPVPDKWEKEDEARVRPAKRIKFARIPFYVNGLRDTSDYIKLIKQVRAICVKFTEEGLANYPRGIPFTFWEQYIWLRKQLLITVIIVLVASFLIISAILVNIWAATIVVVILAMTTVELFGFLGLAGIKLSAVPAVTMIFSVGVGVEFTVHLCMVFVASVGNRNERIQQALESVLSPVVDGAVSTILGVVMLAGSEFDFVVKYFFHVLAALIVIGFLNGIVLFPVILSLIGPNSEFVPLHDSNSTPCTRSWFGLTAFDRNTCTPVSSLSRETEQCGAADARQESTRENEAELQNKDHFDSRTQKPKRGISPRNMYGKTLPSLTRNTKPASTSDAKAQNSSNIRNSHGIAEVTATTTFTVKLPVELKQERLVPAQRPDNNAAIVPRYTPPHGDMQVVDIEDEFV